jgi:hypothetical protein
MRSETQTRKQLENLESDLKFWRAKFDRETDNTQRRVQGNTINFVEGQVEALEWVLEILRED